MFCKASPSLYPITSFPSASFPITTSVFPLICLSNKSAVLLMLVKTLLEIFAWGTVTNTVSSNFISPVPDIETLSPVISFILLLPSYPSVHSFAFSILQSRLPSIASEASPTFPIIAKAVTKPKVILTFLFRYLFRLFSNSLFIINSLLKI